MDTQDESNSMSESERSHHASSSSQQPLLSDNSDMETLVLPSSEIEGMVKSAQSDDEPHKSFASLISMKVSSTPFSSTQSALSPTCRICQLPLEENNVLITPCRCDGTLKYVHGICLRKWLETKEKKSRSHEFVARCELCNYPYKRHKFFKCSSWRCPRVAFRDKLLHSIFLVSLVLMVISAATTILCFVTVSRGNGGGFKFGRSSLMLHRMSSPVTWLAANSQVEGASLGNFLLMVQDQDGILTVEERVTLGCGIIFFLSFFVAMSVEIKAKKTIYQIVCKFLRYNTVWVIENYQPESV